MVTFPTYFTHMWHTNSSNIVYSRHCKNKTKQDKTKNKQNKNKVQTLRGHNSIVNQLVIEKENHEYYFPFVKMYDQVCASYQQPKYGQTDMTSATQTLHHRNSQSIVVVQRRWTWKVSDLFLEEAIIIAKELLLLLL